MLTMVYYCLLEVTCYSHLQEEIDLDTEVGGRVSFKNKSFFIVRVVISLITPTEIWAFPES